MTKKRGTSQGKRDDEGKRHALRRPSPSAMGGALFGGVMGSALGPIGAAAGMVIGGLAGEVVDRHYDREREPADSSSAA